jgi:hypothetical protein
MADLHKFEEDLNNKPGRGSNAPPVSIRAKDLDGNFAKLVLLESENDPPEYEVEYTEEGTRLYNLSGLPAGAEANEFNVCENGNPRTYWFVTWDEKPEILE